PRYVYPSFPDYSVDYWDVGDLYPYPEIRVLHRYGTYCVIFIPGAGYFYVPIPVVSGWVYDPVYFEVAARYVFLRHAIAYDRYDRHDYYWRRRELYNMIYLAQRSGRTDLLVNLGHELDYLNARSNWASHRIRRLEHQLAELEAQQRGFGGRLPQGVDLVRTISDSFNAQQNINVVQNFDKRIKTDLNLQNQLAGVAGHEMSTLRTRIAGERDPQKRVAMWNEVGRVRAEVAQGKALIPPKERGLKELLTMIETERDPVQQSRIQQQILGELNKRQGAVPLDETTQTNVASLKQDITRIQNPQTRQVMETRFADLEQSLQTRKMAEAERQRAEQLADQISKETDTKKREDLVGKLKELSKTVPLMAVPGGMQLLEERRKVERQLVGEKDPGKREGLQQTLEGLRRRQEEANRQHLIEVAKPPQQRLLEQQERDRQAEMLRKQQEEQKKLTDQQLREQQERDRQADIGRKEQEEKQKQVEQRLREQQERDRQADIGRKEQEDKQKQVEQRLREQQERDRQADIGRKEQEEKQKQVEQRLREQQEREKQAERERRDRDRQVQEQLRRQ
ncbi:MAG: hypothetical protein FJY85_11540, partial [Deltaproteobacteria bacterium]|nr:hypothetical protein [Deltaproteobacteria bacterium]